MKEIVYNEPTVLGFEIYFTDEGNLIISQNNGEQEVKVTPEQMDRLCASWIEAKKE